MKEQRKVYVPWHAHLSAEDRERYIEIKNRMILGERVSKEDFMFVRGHDQRSNARKRASIRRHFYPRHKDNVLYGHNTISK